MRPIKFIHMADTHLGNVQYNLFERFRDFNRAFNAILLKALNEKVDFIIHGGDFFNSNKINPETLSAVYLMIKTFHDTCMKKLERKIPIIVIEGNHDKRNFLAKRSWLKFLADLELIILLSLDNKKEEEQFFRPYSQKSKRGSYIKIKDTIIYGIQYYGAITQDLIPKIHNALPTGEDSFNILLMHFGVTGQIKGKLGVDLSDNLLALHQKIDYLGLGHFHKQFRHPHDNAWIFNPGSTEINSPKEFYGDDGAPFPRGVFLVEATSKKTENIKVTPIEFENGDSGAKNSLPNRQFYDLPIDFTKIEPQSFEKLTDFVLNIIQKKGFTPTSAMGDQKKDQENLNLTILFLSLSGLIPFSKLDLNFSLLREKIMHQFQFLEVRIFAKNLASQIDGLSIEAREDRSIEELETEIFTEMVSLNPKYAPQANEIVSLLKDIKKPLLTSSKGNSVYKEIMSWWRATYKADFEDFDNASSKQTLADFVPQKEQMEQEIKDGEESNTYNEEDFNPFDEEDLDDDMEDINF